MHQDNKQFPWQPTFSQPLLLFFFAPSFCSHRHSLCFKSHFLLAPLSIKKRLKIWVKKKIFGICCQPVDGCNFSPASVISRQQSTPSVPVLIHSPITTELCLSICPCLCVSCLINPRHLCLLHTCHGVVSTDLLPV